MAKIILGLEKGYIAEIDRADELTGRAQCSINTIRGGSATNIIPDLCEAEVDRRMVPGEEPDEVLSGLRAALETIRRDNPDIEYEMDVLFVSPPLKTSPASPLVTLTRRVLSHEGLPDGPVGVTYATNAGDLSRRGIDTIVFGPGDVAQAHTRDEWIDLEELKRSVRVYRALMSSQ